MKKFMSLPETFMTLLTRKWIFINYRFFSSAYTDFVIFMVAAVQGMKTMWTNVVIDLEH